MKVILDSQLVHCSKYCIYNLHLVDEDMKCLSVFFVCSHTYDNGRACVC